MPSQCRANDGTESVGSGPHAEEETMSFSGAASHAKKAEDAARASKNHYTDHEDRKLAESVEHLAKAVKELAEALNQEF